MCEDLVGEARGHHEAGVTSRATQVYQTAFRQHENLVPVRETVFVDLGLDVDALHAFSFVEEVDLDFVIEMADVRDDRLILHRLHVFEGNHIHVARGGDVNISPTQRFFDGGNFITFHRRLKRVNRIDFRHNDPRALTA